MTNNVLKNDKNLLKMTNDLLKGAMIWAKEMFSIERFNSDNEVT